MQHKSLIITCYTPGEFDLVVRGVGKLLDKSDYLDTQIWTHHQSYTFTQIQNQWWPEISLINLFLQTFGRHTLAFSVLPSIHTEDFLSTQRRLSLHTEVNADRRCHPISSPFVTMPIMTCCKIARTSLCWSRKYFDTWHVYIYSFLSMMLLIL